jgi:hypothetical protein
MDAMLSLTGPWLRTFADKEKLSVGRVRVPHHGESKWVGNWCWNGYVLTMKASAFVLSHLRERRFTPEYGIDPLFPLWHEREITIDDLKAVFRS